MKKQTAFIICPTYQYINRGFETHSFELFSMLKKEYKGRIYLLKGSGKTKNNEIKILHFKKNSILNKLLTKVFNKAARQIQNSSFVFFSFLQFIIKKPNVIYFGDPILYHLYSKWRKMSNQNYKIIFFTGGQSIPKKFSEKDTLIAGNNYYYKLAKSRNIKNITKIPEGFNIDIKPEFLAIDKKNYLKKQLKIPLNMPIIISVGVLNQSIKRMDYVINEVAKLKTTVFLILLGQKDQETNKIIKLAQKKLSNCNFLIKTVPKNKINSYYKIADIFVLASTKEGFGRVYVEALSNGLIVLTHDYEVAKNTLLNYAQYKDLTITNNLSKLITYNLYKILPKNQKLAKHQFAYQNYSWDILKKDYLSCFNM